MSSRKHPQGWSVSITKNELACINKIKEIEQRKGREILMLLAYERLEKYVLEGKLDKEFLEVHREPLSK